MYLGKNFDFGGAKMKKALVLCLIAICAIGLVFSEEVILPVVDGGPMFLLPSKAINPGNAKERYKILSFNENNIESVDALGEVSAKPISQNYVMTVFADVGDGIVVKEIKTETTAIYLNEEDYGRILSPAEFKKVTISSVKKEDGNFELVMTKVPKGTYRINIKVVVSLGGIDYLITFQLNNQKLIPIQAKDIPPEASVEETEVEVIQSEAVPITSVLGDSLQ